MGFVAKKALELDRKTVKAIDSKLQNLLGKDQEILEMEFEKKKVVKVSICKGYPNYVRAEIYSGDVLLDAMEQYDTILGDYIFWTDDGEYILDIVEKNLFCIS